jgi:hypothetical protein
MYAHCFAGEGPGHSGFSRRRKATHDAVFGDVDGSGCASARHCGELQKIATVHSLKLPQLLEAGWEEGVVLFHGPTKRRGLH